MPLTASQLNLISKGIKTDLALIRKLAKPAQKQILSKMLKGEIPKKLEVLRRGFGKKLSTPQEVNDHAKWVKQMAQKYGDKPLKAKAKAAKPSTGPKAMPKMAKAAPKAAAAGKAATVGTGAGLAAVAGAGALAGAAIMKFKKSIDREINAANRLNQKNYEAIIRAIRKQRGEITNQSGKATKRSQMKY